MRLDQIKKAVSLADELAAIDARLAMLNQADLTLQLKPDGAEGLTIVPTASFAADTKSRLAREWHTERDIITGALEALGVAINTQKET